MVAFSKSGDAYSFQASGLVSDFNINYGTLLLVRQWHGRRNRGAQGARAPPPQ